MSSPTTVPSSLLLDSSLDLCDDNLAQPKDILLDTDPSIDTLTDMESGNLDTSGLGIISPSSGFPFSVQHAGAAFLQPTPQLTLTQNLSLCLSP